MATNFAGGSTKTLPATLGVGRHDGHADGHLNCVALRHGWSRTFSIPSSELAALDYDTLETILEINTLKLRPIGLRIYVENPADSGNWSKIRYWKHDGSLQTTLVQAFFEQRRIAGTLTRLDIRDGNERHAEGDTLSLRTVGSRILNRKHDDNKSNTSGTTRWFGISGLSRNNSTSSRKVMDRMASTDVEDEDGHGIIHMEPEEEHDRRPRPPPASTKPSFFSLLRPHPKIPNQPSKRRSIFDFFREKLTTNITVGKSKNPRQRIPEETPLEPSQSHQTGVDAQREREAEAEQLRKRGWIPPGLVRRHRSLKERLRAEGLATDGSGGSRNPFFGSSKSILNRAERKKAANLKAETENDHDHDHDGHDPFGDENATGDQVHGPIVLTEEDIDDFFEVEAPTSTEMANMPHHERSWSRFKPTKDRRHKDKDREGGKDKEKEKDRDGGKDKGKGRANTPPNGNEALGNGAAIVAKPRDAFPDSPHHRAADAMLAKEEMEVD